MNTKDKPLCPRCGCPPRAIIEVACVRRDLYGGRDRVLRAVPGDAEYECGGGHRWPKDAEIGDLRAAYYAAEFRFFDAAGCASCGALNVGSWARCSRPKGHQGDHAAITPNGTEVADTWGAQQVPGEVAAVTTTLEAQTPAENDHLPKEAVAARNRRPE